MKTHRKKNSNKSVEIIKAYKLKEEISREMMRNSNTQRNETVNETWIIFKNIKLAVGNAVCAKRSTEKDCMVES